MALVDGDINTSFQRFNEKPVEGLDSPAPTQDEIVKNAQDLAEKQRHLSSQSDLSEPRNSISKT